jgi:hypothetical protein
MGIGVGVERKGGSRDGTCIVTTLKTLKTLKT